MRLAAWQKYLDSLDKVLDNRIASFLWLFTPCPFPISIKVFQFISYLEDFLIYQMVCCPIHELLNKNQIDLQVFSVQLCSFNSFLNSDFKNQTQIQEIEIQYVWISTGRENELNFELFGLYVPNPTLNEFSQVEELAVI